VAVTKSMPKAGIDAGCPSSVLCDELLLLLLLLLAMVSSDADAKDTRLRAIEGEGWRRGNGHGLEELARGRCKAR